MGMLADVWGARIGGGEYCGELKNKKKWSAYLV